MPWRARLTIVARGLGAGACIAFALPPWGWWPLAFAGIALWDRLLDGQPWPSRFRRTWLVGVAWFFPSMLWMFDLTPPGYVIACVSYAAYFGAAVALVPAQRPFRWIALPGAIVLATFAMWAFPFGGVPLANLALTQSGSCAPPCRQLDSPLPQVARLLGPLAVVALVVVVGIAASAAWERRWRAVAVAATLVAVCVGAGFVAPRGEVVGRVRIAAVQGGGEQRTGIGNADADAVFARHLAATRLVRTPVDLIVWPENTVSVEGRFEDSYELTQLAALADEMRAPILVGVTEGISRDNFLNASVLVLPDGNLGDRFDKVRIVPFGEFVPLRTLIEKVAGSAGIPGRDAVPGTGHGTVATPAGTYGIVISWEVFFDGRARDAISSGGEALLNPTNGASYWLTQVQTQQIASSRLRAIETGRWVVQAAPTGFSAIITPAGDLLERSDVSEQRIVEGAIERRSGDTVSTLLGRRPMLLAAIAAMAVAALLERRRRDEGIDHPREGVAAATPL